MAASIASADAPQLLQTGEDAGRLELWLDCVPHLMMLGFGTHVCHVAVQKMMYHVLADAEQALQHVKTSMSEQAWSEAQFLSVVTRLQGDHDRARTQNHSGSLLFGLQNHHQSEKGADRLCKLAFCLAVSTMGHDGRSDSYMADSRYDASAAYLGKRFSDLSNLADDAMGSHLCLLATLVHAINVENVPRPLAGALPIAYPVIVEDFIWNLYDMLEPDQQQLPRPFDDGDSLSMDWTDFMKSVAMATVPTDGEVTWEGYCWQFGLDRRPHAIRDMRLAFKPQESWQTSFSGTGTDRFGRLTVSSGQISRRDATFKMLVEAPGVVWQWAGLVTPYGLVGTSSSAEAPDEITGNYVWLWKNQSMD